MAPFSLKTRTDSNACEAIDHANTKIDINIESDLNICISFRTIDIKYDLIVCLSNVYICNTDEFE